MPQNDFFLPLLELSRAARKKGSLVLSTDDIAKCVSGDYKKASKIINKYLLSGLLIRVDNDEFVISNAGWIIIHNRKMREKLWSIFIIVDGSKKHLRHFKKSDIYYELTPSVFFKEFDPSDYQIATDESVIHIVGKSDKLKELWKKSHRSIKQQLEKVKEKIDLRVEKIKKYSNIDPSDEYLIWTATDYSKRTLDYILSYLLLRFCGVMFDKLYTITQSEIEMLRNNLPEKLYTLIKDTYALTNEQPSLNILQKIVNCCLVLYDYISMLHQEVHL